MVNKDTNYGGFLRAARSFVLLLCLLPFGQAVRAATTIDIMLVYDNSGSAWVASNGGIATFSQDVVTRLNQAMQNSGIDANFRLVHAMAVDYDTTSGPRSPLGDDLDALSGGAGVFADVHHARDTYGADLVGMLVDHGSAHGYVGVGWVLSNWSGTPDYAYTVNAIQAVALNHTLTHEMGHNFGADHSKDQASDPGPNSALDGEYSAGWYFTGTNGVDYHTIMAYDDSDNDGRPDYTEAPLFSTPRETYQGTAAGDATNGDNARLISETKDVVAAYRNSVVDPDPVDPDPVDPDPVDPDPVDPDPVDPDPVDPDPVDPDPLPDLIATSVTSAATGTPGGQIEVTATASNQGDAAAGSNWLGYYLSTDSTITLSDIYTGWGCGVDELGPDETRALCSGSISLPADIPPGTYYFGAYADKNEEVTESDETNNGTAATNSIVIGDGIDPNPFSSPSAFVAQQYRDLFGSEGPSSEISYLASLLDGGGMSQAEVVEYLFEQPEYDNIIGPVARLYFAYFERIPDADGLLFWMGYLRDTNALSSISQGFTQSLEFELQYGALSDQDFVALVYLNVLNRQADADGLAFWVSKLVGGLERGDMMLEFSESIEYGMVSEHWIETMKLYTGLLRRSPTQAEFDQVVASLSGDTALVSWVDSVLSWSEYANRF